MSGIIDVFLECILLGTIDATSSKRVPLLVRALLSLALLVIYLGLLALLLTIGIKSGSIVLILCAIAVLIAGVSLVYLKVKKIKSR